MSSYTLPAQQIPLHDGWDVIVIGGGPTGSTAAAAAAREGAKTLLIEATWSLGGMGTSALVPSWTPFSDKEKIIYRGLAEQVFVKLRSQMPHIQKDALDWVAIDPEKLKRIYDDLVLDNGGKILFGTHLARVEAADGEVKAIVVTNKAGLSAYQAKVYIDTTGDADVCAWAGADFHQGNAKGEKLMPATHCFIIANVDTEVYEKGENLHPGNRNSPIYAIMNSGKYPEIPDTHLCSCTIGPGTLGFNAGHVWHVDNTKPETVSAAVIQGRKMADAYQRALAEFYPAAFGHSFLVTTGSLLGIRETRRIVGDYELTLKDYLDRRTFEDEICRNAYFIDVHWAKEEAANTADAFHQMEKQSTFRYEKGESHGLPYRCLTPKGLRNVLVAGRSVSAEQIVQGSIRVMPVCLAMGEAAGIAAAYALEMATPDVHAVDTRRLRTALRNYGAYLPLLESEKTAVVTSAEEPELAAV